MLVSSGVNVRRLKVRPKPQSGPPSELVELVRGTSVRSLSNMVAEGRLTVEEVRAAEALGRRRSSVLGW